MKKKLLFVNDEMTVGGVSRVLINLLNNLDIDKYDVSLLVLHGHGDLLNQIPKNINVIYGTKFFDVCDIPISECIKKHKFFKKFNFYIGLKTGLISKQIIKERKKMNLDNYDVEIAFKEGICSVFTACGNSKRKINWVHSDYKVMNYSKNYMRTMRNVFAKFDSCVAVSELAAKSFEDVFRLKNVKTIHNLLNCEEIIEKSNKEVQIDKSKFSFVSVGRLHAQKSYDRLLEACKKLNDDGYDYNVYILGDGELKNDLLKQKEKLKLDNVYFLGYSSNPYPYIKECNCMVLSSLYEGLATVIFESLILKTPVLSLEVAGVCEQLKDKYGLIKENNIDSLVVGMKEIIDDKNLYDSYKNNLKDYQYDNDKIIKMVEEVVNE